MNNNNTGVYLYILVMAVVTYLIRMLPLVLSRKEITNRYIKSFLYYVPYACLAAMTFPAILTAPAVEGMSARVTTAAGVVGFIVAAGASWKGRSLLRVALSACVAVFLAERILLLFL